MRVVLDRDPFDRRDGSERMGAAPWPACWLRHPDEPAKPWVAAFRCRFSADSAEPVRIHVTADERYELFLDGERVGRGPERGDPEHWCYETYDLPIGAGEHVLVARVWAMGDAPRMAPMAQMTLRPGFLLAAEGPWHERLSTGAAAWQAKLLDGHGPVAGAGEMFGVGARQHVDGDAFPWGFERGGGEGWQAATAGPAGYSAVIAWGQPRSNHRLRPALLPAMVEAERRVGVVRHAERIDSDAQLSQPIDAGRRDAATARAWQAMLDGGPPVHVEPRQRFRVIVDLGDYYCFYPQLRLGAGRGSTVELQLAEALHQPDDPKHKANRDQVDGLVFSGAGDRFIVGGGEPRTFETLWWRAGRYAQFLIGSADEPLSVEAFTIRETRYPLEAESRFACDEPRWPAAERVMFRGLQMCSHEHYMDCPYYEQLMYVGDTRLEALTTYTLLRDSRLPRKALLAFDWSRRHDGLTQARYPCSEPQVIPPFSLWWVAMAHDYALWRDDADTVRAVMPGVRSVLEAYRAHVDGRGLVGLIDGWNFSDWVPAWRPNHSGSPPGAQTDASGVINWHTVLALVFKADLESWCGDPSLAARDRRGAEALAAAIDRAFWDEDRGLYADDLEHRHFSEHAQCLALLSGLTPPRRREQLVHGLFADPDLERATIYFSHYLFEACRLTARIDVLFDRLRHWLDLPSHGFKTPPEEPEPTRSDCHAWGAHPLFHMRATVLGVRPTSPGFRAVSIRPQLGPLQHASGTLPHPRGEISVEVRRQGDRVTGRVRVPEGVTGVVIANDHAVRIEEGGCEFA